MSNTFGTIRPLIAFEVVSQKEKHLATVYDFFQESLKYVSFLCHEMRSVRNDDMSLVMRKPDFYICENKDADQLRGNREADQRLCFRHTDSTIPLLPTSEFFKPLAIFCGCTDQFVSDLVGNPEDRFSHNEAHIIRQVTYLTGF